MTPFATFDLWRVPTHRVPSAVARIAFDRSHLRRLPGLRFAKLLGTGSGRTLTMRDADLHQWALFAVWDSADDAEAFEESPTARAWTRRSEEHWRLDLMPVRARGLWAGRDPFSSADRPDLPRRAGRHDPTTPSSDPRGPLPSPPGTTVRRLPERDPSSPGVSPGSGLCAALTRARLTARGARRFWRSVPPVADELARCPGLRFAIGIGEAPLATVGTLSVWDDAAAMSQFAYRQQAHAAVIRRTAEVGWYAEQLFARFVVIGSRGTVDSVEPLTKH